MFGFDDIEVRYILTPHLPLAIELIGTLLCVQVRHHVSIDLCRAGWRHASRRLSGHPTSVSIGQDKEPKRTRTQPVFDPTSIEASCKILQPAKVIREAWCGSVLVLHGKLGDTPMSNASSPRGVGGG